MRKGFNNFSLPTRLVWRWTYPWWRMRLVSRQPHRGNPQRTCPRQKPTSEIQTVGCIYCLSWHQKKVTSSLYWAHSPVTRPVMRICMGIVIQLSKYGKLGKLHSVYNKKYDFMIKRWLHRAKLKRQIPVWWEKSFTWKILSHLNDLTEIPSGLICNIWTGH